MIELMQNNSLRTIEHDQENIKLTSAHIKKNSNWL